MLLIKASISGELRRNVSIGEIVHHISVRVPIGHYDTPAICSKLEVLHNFVRLVALPAAGVLFSASYSEIRMDMPQN